MGRSSHAPGFRFCPTDEELIMYYLKRKVMGKKFHSEVIAEVNIYRFSPWDLPDKSCLKTKDRIWYFFCPREKKYASGARVTRATENGYWKTTGKDRPVIHNAKKVGTIKTLVFHLGHAPHGERTDWVLHEYRILDDQLAAAGVQDTYVLCEIFKKNGPGPKNGEQYGAPFNEADWADDDTDDDQSHAISLTSDGPSATLLPNEDQICTPVTTGLLAPGKMSGTPLTEGPSISSDKVAGEVLVDETNDEIVRLLDPFTDDDMLREFGGDQDDLSGEGKKSLPSSEEYNIYNGLGDIDTSSLQMNEFIPGFSRMENDCSSLENTSLDNLAFIELDDLLTPLDCPIGFTENDQSSIDDIFRSYGYGNIQQSYSGPNSAHASQLPNETYAGDNHFVPIHMVNGSLNQGVSNAYYDLGFELSQLDNGANLPQDIPRGSCADN